MCVLGHYLAEKPIVMAFLSELDLPIATSTIRYRLIEANLRARRPGKLPMLKTVHMKNRLQFAKKFINEPDTVWRNILWSDETKVVQFVQLK